jgi:hypothetical protein
MPYEAHVPPGQILKIMKNRTIGVTPMASLNAGPHPTAVLGVSANFAKTQGEEKQNDRVRTTLNLWAH